MEPQFPFLIEEEFYAAQIRQVKCILSINLLFDRDLSSSVSEVLEHFLKKPDKASYRAL